MNQLEGWHEQGVIQIEMAQPAQQEAACGSGDRARKTYDYVYTMTMARTSQERESLRRIEEVLFPATALTTNEKNDVEIIFNAVKYGCILVTADGASRGQPGGILGSRTQLRQLGAEILTDREAVERVRGLIARRDERARNECLRTGEALPPWVGMDSSCGSIQRSFSWSSPSLAPKRAGRALSIPTASIWLNQSRLESSPPWSSAARLASRTSSVVEQWL